MKRYFSNLFPKLAKETEQSQQSQNSILQDHHLKILVCGSPQCGKSSFCQRFTTGSISPVNRTIGPDVNVMALTEDYLPILERFGRAALLHLIEVPFQMVGDEFRDGGQPKRMDIHGEGDDLLYNGVDGIVLMFDLSFLKSIQGIDTWRRYFVENGVRCPIILCGNKMDKNTPQIISDKQLNAFIRDTDIAGWFLTSCKSKSDNSVQKAMGFLLNKILKNWYKNYRGYPPPRRMIQQSENGSVDVPNSIDNASNHALDKRFLTSDCLDEEFEKDPFHIENELCQNNEPLISHKSTKETDCRTDQKISLIREFEDEFESFFVLIRQRLKEYISLIEKNSNKHGIASKEYLEILESECCREQQTYEENIKQILNVYEQAADELDGPCRKQYAQLKRQFYTETLDTWSKLWYNISNNVKLAELFTDQTKIHQIIDQIRSSRILNIPIKSEENFSSKFWGKWTFIPCLHESLKEM